MKKSNVESGRGLKRLWAVLGGIGGWAVGGPIGMILGAALGHVIGSNVNDGDTDNTGTRSVRTPDQAGDFHISLLILSAVVIKSDGKSDQRELDFVRKQFVAMFGKDKANESFRLFSRMVSQNIDLPAVCRQIRLNMSHSGRLQLIHFLFQVAGADGHAGEKEIATIQRIARLLAVSQLDFRSILATFAPPERRDTAYDVLEIKRSASNDEVKNAYRKMVKKYHPDKLQGMGEDVRKAAQEKFVKVQEAYDYICKERGI